MRRNDRYENVYYDRNRKFYDNNNDNYNYKRENRSDEFNNKDNIEQNDSYIKCYVSGYMMLKIKK